MKFTKTHKASLLACMREEFGCAEVAIGDVYKTSSGYPDAPSAYVEFFVDGVRHLADVDCRADGSVDWVY